MVTNRISLAKERLKILENCDCKEYIQLKENGSCGGKIIGAGGGGFFMMAVTGNVNEYLKNIFDLGFHSLDWQFDNQGSHVIDQVGCHII